MKRSKLTPEVIVKSLVAFLFGMVVGFLSFRLVTHFSPNFASAKTEKDPVSSPEISPEEKTFFPLPLESKSEKENLQNDFNAINVFLKAYPNIKKPEPKKEEPKKEELKEEKKEKEENKEEETSTETPEDTLDEEV